VNSLPSPKLLQNKEIEMSMNLGTAIDKLYRLKETKNAADAKATEAAEAYKAFEAEVIELLKAQDTRKSSGKMANFSIKPSIVPVVANWDLFYPYIYKNKAGYLLERRPTVVACRELFLNKGYDLDKDDRLTSTKTAIDFTEKYGLSPFIKFTPHLTKL
jgi:hypothetical protein